jgi:hypothetical protein
MSGALLNFDPGFRAVTIPICAGWPAAVFFRL